MKNQPTPRMFMSVTAKTYAALAARAKADSVTIDHLIGQMLDAELGGETRSSNVAADCASITKLG